MLLISLASSTTERTWGSASALQALLGFCVIPAGQGCVTPALRSPGMPAVHIPRCSGTPGGWHWQAAFLRDSPTAWQFHGAFGPSYLQLSPPSVAETTEQGGSWKTLPSTSGFQAWPLSLSKASFLPRFRCSRARNWELRKKSESQPCPLCLLETSAVL